MIKYIKAEHKKSFPYYLKKLIAFTNGRLHNNGIRAYWWNSLPNAGDLIVPFLFRHYGMTPIHTDKHYAEIITCGSVLQKMPQTYQGIILGAGILNPSIEVHLPDARILALRGKMTRDWIGASNDTVLGDPGLLVDRLFKTKNVKQFKVGLIPHYLHKDNHSINSFAQKNENDLVMIDIQKKPKHVLKMIAQCDYIISTALHGLIFADTLGIPSVWLMLDEYPSYESKFKYLDYYSALEEDREPNFISDKTTLSDLIKHAQLSSPAKVRQVKQQLNSLFLKMRDEFQIST